jgi:acyl transferase domain-containing protein
MQAYGDLSPRSVGLTSFKSLVGHTKAAAGIGGLIKAAIAVNQRIIPPTVNCQEPNPVFDEIAQGLYPVQLGEIYPETAILRAGVSAMGFGGINSHVTLSSGDHPSRQLKPPLAERALLVSSQDTELFVLGAASTAELRQDLETLQKRAKGMSVAEMTDLAAYLAQQVNPRLPLRAALIAGNPTDLENRLEQLTLILQQEPLKSKEVKISPQKDLWLSRDMQGAKIGFLFPGQGSQRLNMARTLIERHFWAQEFLAQADQWLLEKGFTPIGEIIYRPLDRACHPEQVGQWFEDLTQVASQAICFVSLLWQKYLQRLGIQPVAVGGHSLGELSAFWSAGVYDPQTLLCFAALRGQIINQTTTTPGTMASLGCAAAQAEKLLQGVAGYVTLANLNSPRQTVISGEKSSVETVVSKANEQEIQARLLPVANAFHSEMIADAANCLSQEAAFLGQCSPLNVPLYSSYTRKQVQEGISLTDHFAEQMTAQVNFIALVEQLAQKCDLLLEVGPAKVLSGLTAEVTASPLCLPLDSKAGSTRDLNSAIAAVFVHGGAINWDFFYENRLIREFIPASERKFLDNPVERPFAVPPSEIEQMTPLTTLENESNFLSEEQVGELLTHYFSERGSFLAQLISADLENRP